jgi:hypothetical protein
MGLQRAIFMGAYDGLFTRIGGQNMSVLQSPKGVHAAGIEWPENPQLARCLARN